MSSTTGEFRPLIAPPYAPRVLIRHVDGGYMERVNQPIWPYRCRNNNETQNNPYSTFILIPIKQERVADEHWEDNARVATVGTELNFDLTALWQCVAIGYQEKNGEITFLSCRRDNLGVGISWAYPVKKLSRFEVFEVERCFRENTFVFKSHNNQYLNYSRTTNTLEFHSGAAETAKWHVQFVDAGHNTKNVLYVGIWTLSDNNATKPDPCKSVTANQRFDRALP